MMILTTNMVKTIDSAFESRIDLALSYPPFDKSQRRKIWQQVLKLVNPQEVNINDADLDKLATMDLNGRHIKSAVKTARLLATSQQEPLGYSHLRVVLELREATMKAMENN